MSKKFAVFTALKWGAFSGTAMLSAFVLPAHIYALIIGKELRLEVYWWRIYLLVVLLAALYHGLYRGKVLLEEVGLRKLHKVLEVLFWVLLVVGVVISVQYAFTG